LFTRDLSLSYQADSYPSKYDIGTKSKTSIKATFGVLGIYSDLDNDAVGCAVADP